MDAMITGLENHLSALRSCQSRVLPFIHRNLMHRLYSLWNYNPENTDEKGDDWNGENFSWFSRRRALPPSLLYYDQDSASLDNGGRILDAIVRPYPAKTAGIPISFEYEMNTGTFSFTWANRGAANDVVDDRPCVSNPPRALQTPLTSRESEIFVPSRLTHGRQLLVHGLSESDRWRYDERRQTLFIVTDDDTPAYEHRVVVSVYPPLKPSFFVNDFWSDFGDRVLAIIVAASAIVAFWIYWACTHR
jgi:hypothetical protein